MAPRRSEFPFPPNPGESEIGSPPSTRNIATVTVPPRRLVVAEELAVLRQQSEADDLDLDSFLDQVVECAKSLTGASGAAVALRQGHVILCRARCGETAPPLGTQIEADSGISGECLRTGRALRCEDSELDIHVDRQVCRRLGLRSIAVVPVFGRKREAGILEVFSPQPHAFDDQDLKTLELLGGLVTTARQRSTEAKSHVAAFEGSTTLPTAVEGGISAGFEASDAWRSRRERGRRWITASTSRPYYAAAIGVFLLALLFTVVWPWLPNEERKTAAAPSAGGSQSRVTAPENRASLQAQLQLNGTESAVSRKPITGDRVSQTSSGHGSKQVVQRAARIEAMSEEEKVKTTASVPPAQQGIALGDIQSPPVSVAQLNGNVSGTGRDIDVMGSVLSVPTSLPQLALRASQGLSGGLLERRVPPVYPAKARSLRLQGSVVLQALIGEDGKVRDLKTISGNPILAQAAMDAVSQWRYRPYRVNGQPVKMQTQITIDFELP